ncbi:hypothetical protein EAS64_14950 [Trebonia kvetii]|uniref:Tetratricopeptide repeat protein n=1 Tax=Trebonia kvetii TaxID=2480626 RepID=A0A6P2BZZ3_9ACTN|nr:hypothetical protein EAS64_14950 [Trebonia kvetii]
MSSKAGSPVRSRCSGSSGSRSGRGRLADGAPVKALRLVRQTGDRLYAGTLLTNLSDYELWIGDFDAARRHLAESIDIARTLDARHSAVIATFNLGLTEYLDGSPVAAEALFAEALDLARRMGMKRHAAYALLGLALAGRGESDPRRALDPAQVLAALGRPDAAAGRLHVDAAVPGDAMAVPLPLHLRYSLKRYSASIDLRSIPL